MSRSSVGLVLAAGEGRRLGRPKALVTGPRSVTWLAMAVSALHEAGVDRVYVAVGASAGAVTAAVSDGCLIVEVADWKVGMGASLRAGLTTVSADEAGADAVVVMLVDTPGVGAAVVRRLTALAHPAALARASYDSEPGHPVLIGRNHWAGVQASAGGDRGARDYLRRHDVTLVECGDIGSGTDVDTPQLLAEWQRSSEDDADS